MFLSTCEIMSTIIGALAGSIASSRVKMDLFGVIVCGTLAALGGGTVRDILLDIPVYWTLPSGEILSWPPSSPVWQPFMWPRNIRLPWALSAWRMLSFWPFSA